MPTYEKLQRIVPDGTVPEDADSDQLGSMAGLRIALSGDGKRLAIGAPYFDGDSPTGYTEGTARGAVFIYLLTSGVWVLEQEIHPNDPAGGLTLFGAALALSDDGDMLAVGSSLDGASSIDDDLAGSVFVFHRSETVWAQVGPRLSAVDPLGGFSRFGRSVDLWHDGTRLIVGDNFEGVLPDGADHALAGYGACYVYDITQGETGLQVDLLAKLSPDDGDTEDAVPSFGQSIAFAGSPDRFVIGGPSDNFVGPTLGDTTGAFWTAVRDPDTLAWSLSSRRLPPDDNEDARGFGLALAASSDWLVVTARTVDDPNVWVYSSFGDDWSLHSTPDSGIDNSLGGTHFAYAPAVSRNHDLFVLGAGEVTSVNYDSTGLPGGVSVYELGGGGWDETIIAVPDDADEEAVFGSAVSLSADDRTLGIGGSWQEQRRGAAWVYQQPFVSFAPSMRARIPLS